MVAPDAQGVVQSRVGVPETDANNAANNAESNGVRHVAQGGALKLKRFTYNQTYDLLLVKSVREKDAHKAPHGKKGEVFDAVRECFLRAMPATVFGRLETPSVKSLRDRYTRLEEKRREAVKKHQGESGNTEEVGEVDQLLDDLILERDEWEEDVREAREERTVREKDLVAAGEAIRECAVSRKRRNTADDNEDSPSMVTTKGKRAREDDFVEEVSTCMMESVRRQRETDDTKLDLESRRLAFEQTRAETDDTRFERTQDLAERRQNLDEERFLLEKREREERVNVERDERKEAREERKAMLDLIRKIMEK